jgi:hypothetical protein
VETGFSETDNAATAGRDNKQRNEKNPARCSFARADLFHVHSPNLHTERQNHISRSLRIMDRFQIAVEWCRFATSPHEIASVIWSF